MRMCQPSSFMWEPFLYGYIYKVRLRPDSCLIFGGRLLETLLPSGRRVPEGARAESGADVVDPLGMSRLLGQGTK